MFLVDFGNARKRALSPVCFNEQLFIVSTPTLFFTGVPQLVWDVFKEVRRPQLPLVRNLIYGVLHPVLLAMPELNGIPALPKKVGTVYGACLLHELAR